MSSATLLLRFAGVFGLLGGAGMGQLFVPSTGVPNQPPDQTQHLRKVTGMVVNAATGAGIGKALVESPTTAGQVSVLTGPDGHFEIDDVPDGAVNLVPRKPGYFNEQELEQGGAAGPRMIQIGESTPDILLRLFPEGVIEGRVLDEAGEPVEGASLQALVSQVREGRRRWEPAGGGSTDDTGAFRLANLRPGQYVLFVNAGGSRGRKPGQNFDLVFAPAFYPGAYTQSEAVPISISAGQHAQADFSLKRQPGYMVTGVVTNLPPGSGASLFAKPAGAANNANMVAQTGAKPNGEFRLGPLPEGDYVLTLQAQNGQTALWQEVPLVIGHADVTNLQLALEQPYEIPVQLTVVRTKTAGQSGDIEFVVDGPTSGRTAGRHMAQGTPLGNISFHSEDGSMQFVTLYEPADQQAEPLVVKGLRPGTYHMNSWGNGAFYVESARCGGTDLLDAPLVLRSGASTPPIQITMRDDVANLTVNCATDGKQQSCAVILAPAHGEPRLFYAWAASSAVASGLAPGDYRAYAFDNAAGLEYGNPEAMRDYLSKGQAFTLEPNDQKTISVEVIHRDAPGIE